MREPEFVTQDVFKISNESLRQRIETEQELNDSRMEQIKLVVGEALSEMKASNNILRQELRNEISDIRAEMRVMQAENKSFHSEIKAAISDIRGDVKALDAKVKIFETRLGWYMTLLGIGVSVGLFFLQKVFG